MTQRGTPVKYIQSENSGEHQSKLQKICEKEGVTLEYTTSHTPQLNVVIGRRFSVNKEGASVMLLNSKLNDMAHKMLWTEAVHTRNSV